VPKNGQNTYLPGEVYVNYIFILKHLKVIAFRLKKVIAILSLIVWISKCSRLGSQEAPYNVRIIYKSYEA
jgi:hypothetical protein